MLAQQIVPNHAPRRKTNPQFLHVATTRDFITTFEKQVIPAGTIGKVVALTDFGELVIVFKRSPHCYVLPPTSNKITILDPLQAEK